MVILRVNKAQLNGDPSQLLPSSFIFPWGDKEPTREKNESMNIIFSKKKEFQLNTWHYKSKKAEEGTRGKQRLFLQVAVPFLCNLQEQVTLISPSEHHLLGPEAFL